MIRPEHICRLVYEAQRALRDEATSLGYQLSDLTAVAFAEWGREPEPHPRPTKVITGALNRNAHYNAWRLHCQGLIEPVPSPDRRIRLWRLTPQGVELARRLTNKLDEVSRHWNNL